MNKIIFTLLGIFIAIAIKSQCTAPSFTVNLSSKTDTIAKTGNQTRWGVC